MTTTSTKSLLTLAAAAVALSMATAMPAQARGGDNINYPTTKFIQKIAGETRADTRRQAARQTASDRSVFSDARPGAALVYDLEPTGNGIARRKWKRN